MESKRLEDLEEDGRNISLVLETMVVKRKATDKLHAPSALPLGKEPQVPSV
jgi:hypothetical protein